MKRLIIEGLIAMVQGALFILALCLLVSILGGCASVERCVSDTQCEVEDDGK